MLDGAVDLSGSDKPFSVLHERKVNAMRTLKKLFEEEAVSDDYDAWDSYTDADMKRFKIMVSLGTLIVVLATIGQAL